MPEASITVGLLAEPGALRARAVALAERFRFTLLKGAPDTGFYLALNAEGLELRQAGARAPGPIRIDFLGGALGHRLRFGGGRGQPLARAVGMKSGFSPSIWDATAGLGRDALVLASLGSCVTLCERAPVLAALLEDGLQRAALDADAGEWIQARMRLVYADSREQLAAVPAAKRPDVVYLDPMYPPGKAGVLVKKEIRALQTLLGPEQDASQLLETALGAARRRVVVKRPGHGEWLAGQKPDTSIAGKKTRYDVYVTLV